MIARQIQADRDAADLANHIDRLAWLSVDAPRWSDGEPVDSHTRNVLLAQSRAAVAAAAQVAA